MIRLYSLSAVAEEKVPLLFARAVVVTNDDLYVMMMTCLLLLIEYILWLFIMLLFSLLFIGKRGGSI